MDEPGTVIAAKKEIAAGTSGKGVSAVAAGRGGFVFSTSAGSDRISLHAANEGEEVVNLDVPGERPSTVCVSHDAVKVAFGTHKGAVYTWDVMYPTAMESFRTEDSVAAGRVSALAWHPRGHVLACASDAGVVHLWDMVVGALLFPVPCHDGPIAGIAWSGNGRLLLTAGADADAPGGGALRVWSPRDVEFLGSVTGDEDPDAKAPRGTAVRWHAAPLTCLDAMADMSRVAVTGAEDGSVLLSVLKPEQGCGVFHAMQRHAKRVSAVRFAPLDAPKPMRAASADAGGVVHLFDMERRLPMGKYRHGEGPVGGLRFSDDADTLYSCAGCSVRGWDARVAPEEEPCVEYGAHGKKVNAFDFVNGGKTIVQACDDGMLRLFDVRLPGDRPHTCVLDVSASAVV